MRNVGKFKRYLFLIGSGLLLGLLLAACYISPRPPRRPLSTFLAKADILLEQQQLRQAVKVLEQAAQIHVDDPLPLLKIGQIYLRQRRWLLAEDAFNRTLARDLQNPAALAGLAEVRFHQGDLSQARILWQQTIALNPELPGIFTGLGHTYLFALAFDQARAAYLEQEVHRADPEAKWYLAALEAPLELTAARNYLGAIPAQSSPDLLARRDYLLSTLTPFTTASPPAEIAQASGIAFVQIEAWPLAIHALTLARDASGLALPEQAKTLAFLGHARAQMGRPALELFQEAERLDPASALPAYFYGIYLRRQKALRAAEGQFERAIELDPGNAAIYVELARVKVEQGLLSEADKAYIKAVELERDNLQLQLLRVKFYANRGYRVIEAGIPAAEALLEIDEDNAEGHDALGWMQILAGDSTGAERSLRRAIELDPALMSARYHLARYLTDAGDLVTAREMYSYIVENDTSGRFRERALLDLQQLGQP